MILDDRDEVFVAPGVKMEETGKKIGSRRSLEIHPFP
jgi:hypothetical protein